ncbi:hypothetical protein VB773_15045 [Haloarculaceae archaeon H-GB2-1]|nr:hypothetical protein [Haloarculaceae archaeon H-GB11]MEA5408751.1 hypothetical protein [Haloarculaceae archaeon H-GB2-1]
MMDGIIELRLTEEIIPNTLIKQFRVRKMSGVLIYPEWNVYEYTSGTGIVTFDPTEQLAQSQADGDSPRQWAEPGRERIGAVRRRRSHRFGRRFRQQVVSVAHTAYIGDTLTAGEGRGRHREYRHTGGDRTPHEFTHFVRTAVQRYHLVRRLHLRRR